MWCEGAHRKKAIKQSVCHCDVILNNGHLFVYKSHEYERFYMYEGEAANCTANVAVIVYGGSPTPDTGRVTPATLQLYAFHVITGHGSAFIIL